jgi:Protein of unknown function (DUF2778)
MTVGTAWTSHFADYGRERLLGSALPLPVIGRAAAVCFAAVCAWTICVNIGGGAEVVADRADKLAVTAERGDELALAQLAHRASSHLNVAAFDSRFGAAFPAGVSPWTAPITSESSSLPLPAVATTANSPRQTGHRLADNTPTALPRSHRRFGPPSPAEEQTAQIDTDAQSAQTDRPGFFERIFGGTPHSIFAKLFGTSPSGVTLAYASTEETGDNPPLTSGLYDRQTAVYDIAAHKVYMPNGTTLEAHSGLGDELDDPRYVAERDRGPTPPDIYTLQPRGALFHGVQALRLVPIDERKVYGRSGLLAHTYMLGPNGQSNGCVSFKDYDAFLHAYENHEITRLAVVTHAD